MPRAQSMYASLCRGLVPAGADVTRHLKIDVVVERVPDRTVLVVRQRDGTLHGLDGNSALDVERDLDLEKPMRILLSPVRHQVRSKASDGMASLREDEDNVGGHAAGQRERQGLHR